MYITVLNVLRLMDNSVRMNGMPEINTFMHSRLIRFFTSSIGHATRQSRITVITVPVIVSIITIRLTAARAESTDTLKLIYQDTYNYFQMFN